MTILPKAVYKFTVIPIKLQMAFFIELGQKYLNLYGNTKDPWNGQSNLEKEKQSWRNQTP